MTFEVGKTYDCVDRDYNVKIIHRLNGNGVLYPLVGVLTHSSTGGESGVIRLSDTGKCSGHDGYTLNPPITSQFRNVYTNGSGLSGPYKSLSDARLGASNNFCATVEFKWRGDTLIEAVVHQPVSK